MPSHCKCRKHRSHSHHSNKGKGHSHHSDHKATPPSVSDLHPWVPRDYVLGKGILESAKFPEKAFFYDSPLALQGTIYRVDHNRVCYPPKYYVRNSEVVFEGRNPGVPGPFDYDQGMKSWANDELYNFGPAKYATLISGFGHTHIQNIVAMVMAWRQNIHANVTAQNLFAEHLVNGSVQIFNWFGKVVDNNGNKIPYSPGTPAGDLRGLFDMFISGAGTHDGIIDADNLIMQFQNFKNIFAPQSKRLQVEIDVLAAYLKKVLNMNGPTNMRAWYYTMKHHQDTIIEVFLKFHKLYRTPKNSRNYEHRFRSTNDACRELVNTGSHMSAFFGAFYSALSFLDILLQEVGASNIQAIPNEYRRRRVTAVHTLLIRYWMEHVSMFTDHQKCAALIDTDETHVQMYKILFNMLESCSNIALYVGEIFRTCDVITREIDIFAKLPPQYPVQGQRRR